MRQNLAQKTYDVYIFEDERWLVDSHHDVRSDALERAEVLIAEKRFEGVRVVAESQRTGEEETVLEEMLDFGDKPVKIVPIEDAPVCDAIADYYLFPARKAAGRLLRELLEQRGQTALELAFDYGALRMLERNDKLFPAAISRIGTIQAKKTGAKPADRNDVLYAAFAEIRENARVCGEDTTRPGFVDSLGLQGLADKAPGDAGGRRIYVLGGLALALSKQGDWSDKLSLLIELGEKSSDALVVEFIDGIAAEILDSSTALTDLFGGFADPMTALRDIIHLTQGRCKTKNARSCIEAFNAFMAARPMPLSKAILLGRVAKTMSGIRPLTREGVKADQDAFRGLVRELTEEAGVTGGPEMAGAIVERGRIAFADPDDLSAEDAINHVLALLPYRAVRLGFLLDLIGAPIGQKNEQAVLNVMARLVQQLTSLASLMPADMPRDQAHSVMEALKLKLASDALPEKWRALFSDTLDRLVKRDEKSKDDPAANEGTAVVFTMEDATVTNQKIERREVDDGEILFEEGDAADKAYLVIDGKVQIFRKNGNEEIVLATLGKGDILGEMSLIDNQPRMASARVVGKAKLTVITQGDLASRLGKLGDNDKVLRRLIDVFVDRLRGQGRLHE
ncbi:cyclic nucleotide-binding domain-containing protein [Thalassospiraceae bacterium LMO-JJ14]|nr:cyclic nucleotide-binding domain-containing protein [Thalassospiraceae bacterium LMO-JJ14]